MEPYVGVIGIVGGFLICFAGLRLLKPCIFVAGLLLCTMLGLLCCYFFFSDSAEDLQSTFYYFLGGGFVAGLIVGWLL